MGKGGGAPQPQVFNTPPPQLSAQGQQLQTALTNDLVPRLQAYQPFMGLTNAQMYPQQGWGSIQHPQQQGAPAAPQGGQQAPPHQAPQAPGPNYANPLLGSTQGPYGAAGNGLLQAFGQAPQSGFGAGLAQGYGMMPQNGYGGAGQQSFGSGLGAMPGLHMPPQQPPPMGAV